MQNKIAEFEKRLFAQQSEITDKQSLIQGFHEKTVQLMPLIKSPAMPEETKNTILKSFIRRIIFDRSKCDVRIFFYT